MGVAAQIPVLASMRRSVHEKDGSVLSGRQFEVAVLAAEGRTNKQIAERLDIAEQTVKNHLRVVFIKKGVMRRGELKGLFGA